MPRVAGKGTTLTYDSSSIATLLTATPPRKGLEMVETTDIDDTTMNQESAILIWGPINFSAYWAKADAGILKILAAGETAYTAVLTQSDGSSYTGSAYAEAHEPQQLDRRNRAVINGTFSPAAGWTYAAGA